MLFFFLHKFLLESDHKFIAKKRCNFMIYLGIIKNSMFFLHKFMHFYCINLWQKVIINLWAIATQKFMAKKCVFFLMFDQIIKNFYVFCITSCFFWRKFFINSDHKFTAKNAVFYDFFFFNHKKSYVFLHKFMHSFLHKFMTKSDHKFMGNSYPKINGKKCVFFSWFSIKS